MTKKTLKLLTTILVITLLITSCTKNTHSDFDENSDVFSTYSRDYVKQICSSISFGKRKLDDTYTVAQYIYSSDEFTQIYGQEFQIEYISGSAEFEQLLWTYKGFSYCRAHINEDIWEFNLTIDYWQNWTIVDYSKLEDNQ